MFMLLPATILTVGLGAKADALENFSARLMRVETANEAVLTLRREFVDAIISKWNLPDMPKGEFIKRIKSARSSVPIAVMLDEQDDCTDESQARTLGVIAVVHSDIDEISLMRVVERMVMKKQTHLLQAVAVEN